VVLCDGRIVLDRPRDQVSPAEVLAASLGAPAQHQIQPGGSHSVVLEDQTS
jgi:hypothetical protein